jgi:hypothetical protein
MEDEGETRRAAVAYVLAFEPAEPAAKKQTGAV